MDLAYPPEAEEFRSEVRRWLEANLPSGWFDPGFQLEGEERAQFNRNWVRKLSDGGSAEHPLGVDGSPDRGEHDARRLQ